MITATTIDERNRLLMANLPVVRYVAHRIRQRLPQHIEMKDLVSAGVIGLLDALSKFDPSKDVQFKTYARFRIRGAIVDSLRTDDWGPRHLRRKARNLEEATRAAAYRLGRIPQQDDVAHEMNVSVQELQLLIGELRALEVVSLHEPHAEDSEELRIAYVEADPEESPLRQFLHGELRERLAAAIEDLPDRERLVMTLHYFEELTQAEVAATLQISSARVSQIHGSAVKRLRRALTVRKRSCR